jgi:hypothetical protein
MGRRDDLNDLRMSDKAMPLLENVKRFVRDVVNPMSVEFHKLGEGRAERGATHPASWNCWKAPRTGQGRRACGTSSCPTRTPAKA